MKIMITGATGLAGSETVRQAILDNDINVVTAVTRKPLKIKSPKLRNIIHSDFNDVSALHDEFINHDACVWCLGISQMQVSKEMYHTITYDYTMVAANEILRSNPLMQFLFLSGEGADQSGKSRLIFARVKGKTEKELTEMPLGRLIIARPGGIRPVHKKENPVWYEKIMFPLYPLIEKLYPAGMIASDVLAKAFLTILKNNKSEIIYNNRELRVMGGTK